MKLSFCFSGWMNDVEVEHFTELTADGSKKILASSLTPDEAQKKLKSGELTISLAECLQSGGKSEEIEISDIEVEGHSHPVPVI